MSAIDDIAKKTIEEISAELAQIGGAHDEFINQSQYQASQKAIKDSEVFTQSGFNDTSVNSAISSINHTSNHIQSSIQNEPALDSLVQSGARNEMVSQEYLFLRNLKERIEVLFEGLGQTKASDLEDRLELTLKFLEFLLATVQNRLENLPK